MRRIVEIIILFLLANNCFGYSDRITNIDTLNINQFEIWKSISKNDTLLSEHYYLDSLLFLKITYKSDSIEVEGFIVEHKYSSNKPIVIFNRGGNRDYYNITERTLIDWIAPIAKNGYSVFASQYRTNDEFGGSDINDVLNLIEVAKKHPNTDSTKIGMIGWSRGGLMTYIALTLTNEIDCAIIGGAPTNMLQLIEDRPDMNTLLKKLIPNYEANRNSELIKRSPIMWADKLHKTELLIIHGNLDERITSQQAISISEKLNTLNYNHTLMIFDNEDHILRSNKELKDATIANWLSQKMNLH